MVLDLVFWLYKALKKRQDDKVIDLAEFRRELSRSGVPEPRARAALAYAIEHLPVAEVEDLFERVLGIGLRSPKILELGADYFLGMRRYAVAKHLASDLCYEHARHGTALRTVGLTHHLLGDYSLALSALNEFLEHEPGDTLAFHFAATAHLRTRSFRSALEMDQRLPLDGDRIAWLAAVQRRRPSRRNWYGRPSHSPYDRKLERFLRDIRHTPLSGRLADVASVDRALGLGRYVSDSRRFREPDVWEAPVSFERHLQGDCEDFALWAWVQLNRMGQKARFTIGGMYSEEINHAWVTLYGGRRVRVLECTPQFFNAPIAAEHAPEYRPVHSIDWQGSWFAH